MKNKSILITGATGFIGSHLAEECVKRGYKVYAFDRYNPNYNLANLTGSEYRKEMEFIFGDIRDYDSVSKAIKGKKYVLHLAALGGIPYSYHSPLAYIKTNVEGTYNVLEASRINNIEQVITTSTSEVYGTAQKIPISEDHPLVGQSPYAATKIAADQLSISYQKSYNSKIKIIRPFNVYGPRQSLRAVIPTIINQCLENKQFIKLGNISTSRDFTYVTDLCDAYFKLLNSHKSFGQPFNIGTGKEYLIKKIAIMIRDNINPAIKFKIENFRKRPEKSEVYRLVCNYKKFKKNSNWSPKIDINNGLKKTIEWFIQNKKQFTNIYHI
jgi:NAD dependent epimerase/dehydratase